MRRLRINIYIIIEYILMLLLLLSCHSVYTIHLDWIFISIVILLVVCIMTKLRFVSRAYMKKIFLLLLLYFVWAGVNVVLVSNSKEWFIAKFILLLPLMVVFFSMMMYEERINFLRRLVNVIFLIAFLSLIMWLMGPMFKIIEPTGGWFVNWGTRRYYSSYFNVCFSTSVMYRSVGGLILPRNISVFTEGPVANLVFSLGLCLLLFLDNDKTKKKVVKIVIFCIAILSTMSTTGYVLLSILILMRFLQKQNRNNVKTKLILFIKKICVPLLVLGGLALVIYFVLSSKMQSDIGNYEAHMGDFGAGLKAFMQHPIIGTGYETSSWTGNTTSGLFKVMSDGGIVFSLIYVVSYIMQIKVYIQKQDTNMLIITGVFFVLLVTVIWQYTFLYIMFIAFGYSMGISRNSNK